MRHFKIWLGLSVDKLLWLVLVWLFASANSKYYLSIIFGADCLGVAWLPTLFCLHTLSLSVLLALLYLQPTSCSNIILFLQLILFYPRFYILFLHQFFLCSSHELYIKMAGVTLWFANTGLKPRVWLYSRVCAILSFWFDLSTII